MATLTNVTITDNTVYITEGDQGAGLHIGANTTVMLNNSIVSGNIRDDGTTIVDGDLYNVGTITAGSANNLIGVDLGTSGLTDGVNGNILGVTDPGLDPLADNGGPVTVPQPPHSLFPGSVQTRLSSMQP